MATLRGHQRNLRDAALLAIIALPAGASTTVVTAAIDTGVRTARASFEDQTEAVLKFPALSTAIVPNASTVTLIIESSAVSNFATIDTLRTVVFTGAGGVGIPLGGELRTSLPSDCLRYVRGKVTFGASCTTGAALNAECALVH
jgi:hypothetical protein